MKKDLPLEHVTDFLNTILVNYDRVAIKRIVSPLFRYSDPGGANCLVYSASMMPNSHIMLCLKDGSGAFTLFTTSNMFTVSETDNGNDSYIYRFEAGEDIHFILTVRNEKPGRTPLEKFANL